MATTAAVLSILVNADTAAATSKLSKFDRQLAVVNDTAKKGIEARLGADYNPRAFDQYQRAMTNAERRAKDRAAFRAELGANFNPRAFNQYERAIERADASAKSATASTKKMSTAAAGAGSAIMGWGKKVAEAAGVIGGASVYAAVKFQAATETLQTQAGASTKQVDALRKGILNMAQDVGQTPDKLAAGMYHVVSSMNAVIPPAKRVATELHIQKIAAEGAAVGHSDLADTTYALASAMNALHAPTKAAKEIMGEMNAIVGSGDMTMSDLLDTMKSGLVPAARTFGISFKSVGAALAVMGDMGIKGADAGTKLRMSIALLGAPSSKAAGILKDMGLSTDQVTAAQSRMSSLLVKSGVSTTQLADDLRKPNGISVALTDLKQHLEDGGLSATAAAATISRAFGGGRSGATIQLLTQNTDRLNKKFNQIGDTAGNFGKNFAETQKTLMFQIHALEAGVTSLGIKLGDLLIPSVQKVVAWLNKFVKQMETGRGAGGKFRRDVTSAFHTARDAVKWFVDTVGGIKPALEIAAGAFVGTKLLKFSGGFARDIGSAVGALKSIPRLLSHLPGLGRLGGLGKASQTIAEMSVDVMVVKSMIGGAGGVPPSPGNDAKGASLFERLTGVSFLSSLAAAAPYVAPLVIASQFASRTAGQQATSAATNLQGLLSPAQYKSLQQNLAGLTPMGKQGNLPFSSQTINLVKQANAALVQFASTRNAAGIQAIITKAQALGHQFPALRDGMRLIETAMRNAAAHSIAALRRIGAAINRLPTTKTINVQVNATWSRAAEQLLGGHFNPLQPFPSFAKPLDTHGHHLGAFPSGGGGGGGGGTGGGGDGGAAATQHRAAHQQAAAAARQHAAAARQHAAALAQQAAAKAQRIAAAKQAAFLAFWARIPSQAAGQQIKSAQIANRLQLATNTGNIGGQTKALNAERRLDKQWIAEDKRKLAKLNRQLARKGLSRKTRNALLQDKLGLIQEITTIEADIGNVATSLQSLGGSTGGFDLMPGSVTLPTPYDVRHSIAGHQHHHHGDIHIHVNKDADVTKVADVIDRTMNSQIHSRLRRAGLRGT